MWAVGKLASLHYLLIEYLFAHLYVHVLGLLCPWTCVKSCAVFDKILVTKVLYQRFPGLICVFSFTRTFLELFKLEFCHRFLLFFISRKMSTMISTSVVCLLFVTLLLNSSNCSGSPWDLPRDSISTSVVAEANQV